MINAALELARQGFYVFPLEERSKLPAITDYVTRATRDPGQIKRWWTCPVLGIPLDRNIGISTSRYGDSQALLVLDVDHKNGKDGNAALETLRREGKEFPPTLESITPTGGRHLIYVVDQALNQHKPGALGPGLDLRSRGGYIVAPPSVTEKGNYQWQITIRVGQALGKSEHNAYTSAILAD
jgi:hypothetical protein